MQVVFLQERLPVQVLRQCLRVARFRAVGDVDGANGVGHGVSDAVVGWIEGAGRAGPSETAVRP